jgi:alpha-galactosidase
MRRSTLSSLFVLSTCTSAAAYNNGVQRTPVLGWNTWCTLSDCHNGDNDYFDRCVVFPPPRPCRPCFASPRRAAPPPHHTHTHARSCNEWEVYSIAEAMVSNGMHKLGFDHVNLDDCWAAESRDADGNIRPDPTRFPSGMKAVAAKLHGMGLKFGLYTSMGDATCNQGGRPTKIPGSYGHYSADARTIASWEMDYVKVDWCGGHLGNPEEYHGNLSAALNATGHPIWLELCRGYSYNPIPGYVAAVAQSWRTTGDHQDEWSNTLKVIESFWAPSNPGVPYA